MTLRPGSTGSDAPILAGWGDRALRLALDTTVLIDALRGGDAAERIRELQTAGGSPPWICAVNVEELYRGMKDPEADAVRLLVDGMRIAPLGDREGELAGTWRKQFAQAGVTLSQADCLIAAAAAGVGATLATGNPKHFPMDEIETVHWPTGR